MAWEYMMSLNHLFFIVDLTLTDIFLWWTWTLVQPLRSWGYLLKMVTDWMLVLVGDLRKNIFKSGTATNENIIFPNHAREGPSETWHRSCNNQNMTFFSQTILIYSSNVNGIWSCCVGERWDGGIKCNVYLDHD